MQIVAPSRVQLAQQLHHRFAIFRIQISGRLIGQQNGRLADQRTRHGHALLLAAGKLRGIMLHAVRHADALEHFLHAFLSLRRAHTAIGERQFDVFINGEVADQIERLEDEADLAIADARAVASESFCHRLG